MLSFEEIKNYFSKYKVENGKVFDKATNAEILDEEIILKTKSSILIVREANQKYQEALQRNRSTLTKTFDDYLKEMMVNFSVNGEIQPLGAKSSQNKLVTELLKNNGNYTDEYYADKTLTGNYKYSLLLEPKKDFFMAYLKLKFREKGLDIENLNVSIDTSNYEHLGNSIVIVKSVIKKYDKKQSNNQIQNNTNQLLQHPKANELNELEKMKQEAKVNHDETAYNYAQANIRNIISNNRMEIPPEKYDSMSLSEKKEYLKIKMHESRVLNDKEEFNFWKSNLDSLNKKEFDNARQQENQQRQNIRKQQMQELIPKKQMQNMQQNNMNVEQSNGFGGMSR